MTIKEVQERLEEHSPKSVESVVHTLASAGQLLKDNSSPRRFTLPAQPAEVKSKSNGKSAGAAVQNGA
jgi:hypothetical protein